MSHITFSSNLNGDTATQCKVQQQVTGCFLKSLYDSTFTHVHNE